MPGDKLKAEAIIVEIIRQAGGVLTNKTNLFKAFYHSHLKYAEANPTVLSDWPIIRMPRGPGIDSCDRLLGELLEGGFIHVDSVQNGPYESFQFTLTDKPFDLSRLTDAETDAIRRGVEEVRGKSAAQVSEESHQRSWESTTDGREMNIYLDLSADCDESTERTARIRKMAEAFQKACG